MSTEEIEAALADWIEAERLLAAGGGRKLSELLAEVELARASYQRLTADHMAERINALKAAEARRHAATPSTDAYHTAAGEETLIAAEIWGAARSLDEDPPRRRPLRR